jgi:PIN domain nuclease of toxin-antitoxin system
MAGVARRRRQQAQAVATETARIVKRYLADTHALLWSLATPERLGAKAARVFRGLGATSEVHVSTVSLWEIAVLHDEGQLRLKAGFSAWHEALAALPGIRIEPLVGADIEEARSLPSLRDPFDRLIAGTSLRLNVPLLSRDARIGRERRVRVIW